MHIRTGGKKKWKIGCLCHNSIGVNSFQRTPKWQFDERPIVKQVYVRKGGGVMGCKHTEVSLDVHN